jgi:phosphoribosylformylglycinamidine synthase I
MASPRVLVLRAPGTNCDHESAFAFEKAGATTERLHVNALLDNPIRVSDYQILCIPGGFSYGDDISAGRILANQIRNRLFSVLSDFKAADRLILGICNGFQILIKSGLILPDKPEEPAATLANNDSGKFEARWIRLAVRGTKCVFLQNIDELELPVAHGEGKFVASSQTMLKRLHDGGQLCLRYVDASSGEQPGYPENPNGAQMHVAGLCDTSGRVFGLMPHPERHIEPTQHPRWTRRKTQPKAGDGLKIFENAVRFFH